MTHDTDELVMAVKTTVMMLRDMPDSVAAERPTPGPSRKSLGISLTSMSSPFARRSRLNPQRWITSSRTTLSTSALTIRRLSRCGKSR